MKKSKKTAIIAATFAVALGLNGCGGTIETEETTEATEESPAVTETEPFDPQDTLIQVEYAAPVVVEPDYDPSVDEVQDVYGPPPDMK